MIKILWLSAFTLLSSMVFHKIDPHRPLYLYTCTRVLDGDTIVARRGTHEYRIRFAYIDAPESKQQSREGIPIGKNSTSYLKSLIEGKRVLIRILKKDLYGRSIGEVYLNKKYINLEMVSKGHAIVYKRSKLEFWQEQSIAMNRYRGIWKTDGFWNPSVYRRRK